MSTVIAVDFNDGARISDETEVMRRLSGGGPPVLYEHTKATKFSTWLAIRRQRMGRNFQFDTFVRITQPNGNIVVYDGKEDGVPEQRLPPNHYYIWVDPV